MSKNKKVLIVIGAAVLIVAVSLISSAITKRHEKAKQAEQMTELFGDDNPFEEADDQEQDESDDGKPDKRGIGESFTTKNGYTITLTGAKQLTEYGENLIDHDGSYDTPDEGNIFVRIDLAAENNSDSPVALYPFGGVACDGNKIETSSRNAIYADPDNMEHQSHSDCLLNDGEAGTSRLYIEVPEDFKEITLKVDDMGQDSIFPSNAYLVVTHDDIFGK